jgi:quercetin dioxygenase-like cupin family protein
MSVPIYQPCTNPVSGETFKALSFNKEAFVMQWTVQPKGYVAFEHIHLNQDEIFHIKKGAIKIVMNGREHIAAAGQTITVPKGMAHIAYNNNGDTLDCLVEYKPGLDHETFMQCFCGLVNDGLMDAKGGIDIPRMGYFLTKMKAKCMARPTSIPAPVFNLALKFFYIRGMVSGWTKLYEKYTGE